MPRTPRFARTAAALLALLVVPSPPPARADTITMKNGIVYRGTMDRDNTIVWVFDGLKRVIVRDSKIAKIVSDDTFRNQERFQLVQPMSVHSGSMPKEVLAVEAEPWNDRGRRLFSYMTARSGKLVHVSMEQAINELGPHLVRLRGVDGFWVAKLATSQVPREVVLGLLAKVERTNQNERLRVARFLIQSEWYKEAKDELDSLLRDFPELRETAGRARASVAQLEAEQLRREIDVRRRALRPKEVLARLRSFPSKEVSPDLLVAVRDELRKEEAQVTSDKALAAALRELAGRLPTGDRKAWDKPLVEVLHALAEAPDAVRDRLDAWQKSERQPGQDAAARFALALSGYVLGADAAVADLAAAARLWKARDLVHNYLASREPTERQGLLEQIRVLGLLEEEGTAVTARSLDALTRLARRMPPPLREEETGTAPGQPTTHRVRDDANVEPTEYAALLPPEYHPLRSYPAVVALHGGQGPQAALDWWAAEAARRGYIVIAPEYNLPGEPKDYRYTTSEHAAVELALRDARRRYAIDGDRVYLGGQRIGGNMAWDLGLAHPDLFAGVVVISGLPAKYVIPALKHTERLPFYFALGDLAPAATEVIYGGVIKPLISKAYDVTYAEYHRRGLEDLPEEAPAVFEWMDRHRRDPFPKSFDVVTARTCDDRFYGVVVRDFAPGRTAAPDAVENFGKNLNPASLKMTTSRPSNLIKIQANGVRRLNVWVAPNLVDFAKRLEIRVNNKTIFKKLVQPDIEPLLEDLRVRGDREQVYWFKVSAG